MISACRWHFLQNDRIYYSYVKRHEKAVSCFIACNSITTDIFLYVYISRVIRCHFLLFFFHLCYGFTPEVDVVYSYKPFFIFGAQFFFPFRSHLQSVGKTEKLHHLPEIESNIFLSAELLGGLICHNGFWAFLNLGNVPVTQFCTKVCLVVSSSSMQNFHRLLWRQYIQKRDWKFTHRQYTLKFYIVYKRFVMLEQRKQAVGYTCCPINFRLSVSVIR